ncbi:Uncharacterized protein Rs2_27421 [Raphanus sativus]|nr:Uncharacterized protein Rs2_27421 [Raphanus sativus]
MRKTKLLKQWMMRTKMGSLRNFSRINLMTKRHVNEKNETNGAVLADDKSGEEDEREGFFKKLFKEKPDDKKDIVKADDGGSESEGDESPEFSLFKKIIPYTFRRRKNLLQKLKIRAMA